MTRIGPTVRRIDTPLIRWYTLCEICQRQGTGVVGVEAGLVPKAEGRQRVGDRWKPDASADAEWAWEPQAETRVGRAGMATVIKAEGIPKGTCFERGAFA